MPVTANTHPARRKLTVPQLARQFGVAEKKILDWIRAGELRAVNLARKPNGRPRYAIDVVDIEAFERGRQVVPDGGVSTTQRLRRQTKQTGVKEFL